METRNLFAALLTATAVFMLYMFLVQRFAPPPKSAPSGPDLPPGVSAKAPPPGAPDGPALGSAPAPTLAVAGGDSTATIELGGKIDPQYPLDVTFSPIGATVESIELTDRDKKGRFRHRQSADDPTPYNLLAPVPLRNGGTLRSFGTPRLWLGERGSESVALDELVWEVAGRDENTVRFAAEVGDAAGGPRVRVLKSFQLRADAPLIDLELTVENRGTTPVTVTLAQDAAAGLHRADSNYDMRKIAVAQATGDGIELLGRDRTKLEDAPTLLGSDQRFAWVASVNKYFGAFMRALPAAGSAAQSGDSVQSVRGLVAGGEAVRGIQPADVVTRLFLKPLELAPGQRAANRFEIYAGPKDTSVLKKVNPAFVNAEQIGYDEVQSLDGRCFCSFHSITVMMTALLRGIHYVIPNYGIAIIILVLIIRGALHPLAVFQQKSMYRMQENMARIQPKMAAIKEKYANDKVKQNQELMTLMAEENVNPAAGMVSFLPLMLQMPILIALWTALNTEIELRLAPFDGWWIRDLSEPDALVKFGGDGFTVPVLGWLPLIGSAFSNIQSLNVLPILMGVSMYLQQKYMPKPHLKARLEQAKNNPQPAGPMGSVEDQIRQQQMVANIMSVMLPIMFYRFPSGLALYWLATNVFGIFESLRITKQIEREKERRKLEGDKPPPKKRPGAISKLLKKIAEQAEEIQAQADRVTDHGKSKPKKKVK